MNLIKHWTAAAAILVLATACSANNEDPSDASPECLDYCRIMLENCSDKFDTLDDCTSACEAYPRREDDLLDKEAGLGSRTLNGNTLECRIYHANNVVNVSPINHCDHASADGGGVCVDFSPQCGEYCGVVVELCVDADGGFADLEECRIACRDFSSQQTGCRADIISNSGGDDASICPEILVDSAACP